MNDRSIYRACSCALVFFSACAGLFGAPQSLGELTVAELHARHTETVQRLDLARLRTTFGGAILGSGAKAVEGIADARLRAMRGDPELQARFRADMAKTGVELAPGMAGIEAFVNERIADDKRVANQRVRLKSSHEFIRGPIRQITMFLNPEHLTKMESGRASRVLQYGLKHTEVPDATSRWTCFDERQINGKDVYWCKTRILLDGMIPPGFEHHSVDARHPTDLSALWESPQDIVSYGMFEFQSGTVQVVGVPFGAEAMIVAAYSDNRQSGFPLWISRCQRLGEDGKMDAVHVNGKSLTVEAMSAYVDRVNALASVNHCDCNGGAFYPRFATFFEQEQDFPDVGWYPVKLRQLIVGRGKTSESGYQLYASSDFELTVSDIERVTPEAVQPFNVNKGVCYLDKDTDISIVVGERHDRRVVDLASARRGGGLFFIANAALITVIFVLIFIRVRRKPS